MKILKNIVLAQKSSFSVGGKAPILMEVENIQELKNLEKPYFVFGGGTNILFSDEEMRIPLVQIKNKEFSIKNEHVVAGAGLNMVEFVNKCAENNLDASSLFYPGTLGGAIYGNAGTDFAISDYLIRANIFENGKIKEVNNQFFDFKYRYSGIKNSIIWNAEFVFPVLDKKDINLKLRDKIKKRAKTQGRGFSAGSFFKNPLNDFAGRLLEEAGCKGMVEGDAEISLVHANFIINNGKATQKNIIALAKKAKQMVYDKFYVILESEVQIVDSLGKIINI